MVVPPPGRKRVLKELHEGTAHMKGLARMHMWWSGMDLDIDQVVRKCEDCQKKQAAPPQAPLQQWSWPKQPWSRIHIDYAGPLQGSMYLVVIDACLEVFQMKNGTLSTTIQKL